MGFRVAVGFIRSFFRFSLGGSSLIFAGILEFGYSQELQILVSHSSVFVAFVLWGS